tara:strand:+ start:820 stop:1257 length:438 start_codon:yes stop_codon:yes gene_type:complete
MEIILVFLVCLLLLNLFRKNKYDDISEKRLYEIRNLINNWYTSLHEFCKIVDEHTKLMDKHEKVFKEIHKELRLYNFSLDITQPPTTTTTSTSTNGITTSSAISSGGFKVLDEIIKSKKKLDKKNKKYKYNVIKLKKEKKDDPIN